MTAEYIKIGVLVIKRPTSTHTKKAKTEKKGEVKPIDEVAHAQFVRNMFSIFEPRKKT